MARAEARCPESLPAAINTVGSGVDTALTRSTPDISRVHVCLIRVNGGLEKSGSRN